MAVGDPSPERSGGFRGWPGWAKVLAPVAGLVLVLGLVGAAASSDEPNGGEAADAAFHTGTIEIGSTTTSAGPSTPDDPASPRGTATTERSDAGDGTTTASRDEPTTAPPHTRPPSSTTTPSSPPTTVPPTTQPPSDNVVQPGSFCSTPGDTAVSLDGLPLTCATETCNGTAYAMPRWRRTIC